MSRNPYKNLARVIAPMLALWSTPAFAQWETAHGYALKTGEKCPTPHDRDPQLRRSDGGTFDIPAGFRGDIEIYGHGVDLIRTVSIPGGFASFDRGVGGAENAARGCGAIGSIVIQFDVAYTTSAGTGTLTFGNQTMRVRIVKPAILRTVWSPQSLRGGSTVGGGAQGPVGAPPPPPPPPSVDTSGANGCGTNGQGCGGSTSVVAGGGGGNRLGSPDDPPRLADAVGGCIDELGGSAVIQGTTLTLTLPNSRNERIDIPCLTRPVFFNVEMGEVSDDVGGFRAGATNQWFVDRGRAVDPPRYSGSLNGFTGPSVVDDANRDYQALRMTAETARTFVGERRVLLSPASGFGGASPITLVLRTDPGYGINAIQVPAGSTRTGNTLEIKYDFLPFGNGSTNVFWRLRALSGAAPATCFAAVSGSNSGAGSGVGRVVLTARDVAACDNARFAIDIAPARNNAGLFSAPFSKSAAFVLPPKGAVQVNPTLPQNPSGRPPLLN